MNTTPRISSAQQETTVSSGVGGVVLNDLALFDSEPHFNPTDHPVWPQHLLHRVGKKQDPL